MIKNYVQREMLTCKYFTGVQHEVCKVGLSYDALPKPIPCIYTGSAQPCEKREYPTREEAEADERETEQRFEWYRRARQAIVAHSGKQRGVAGKMPCPICLTGEVRYSIAKSNGHIHAGCTTKNCVRWME